MPNHANETSPKLQASSPLELLHRIHSALAQPQGPSRQDALVLGLPSLNLKERVARNRLMAQTQPWFNLEREVARNRSLSPDQPFFSIERQVARDRFLAMEL